MSARRRLPNRRPCVTYDKFIDGKKFTISLGYPHALAHKGTLHETGTANFPSTSEVKEIFVNVGKSGEHIESFLRADATLCSINMQRGADIPELVHSLPRNPDGSSATPIGVILEDLLPPPVEEVVAE